MYLSKLVLDPGHPQARRDLANAYEMHRTLSRAFAPSPESAPARFLWRLESSGPCLAEDEAIVLVQSATPGNWQALQPHDGYSHRLYPNKQVELDRLLQDRRGYVFRLLCNPTVTRAGKRYGLLREAEQLAWLERQGQLHGFELARAEVGRSERITVRQGRGGNQITLQAVQFDGLLQATNVEKLERALRNGIGHAKALGLGMLSIAPVASLHRTENGIGAAKSLLGVARTA
jgi:CRISPR system Cascade subunit CasE